MIIKLAYCGDNCTACPRYVATISGSLEQLKESAKLMEKVGWGRDMENIEGLKCRGCQDIESCEYGVKECCLEKNIENCGLCEDYPCSLINKAFEITSVNAEKFKDILTTQQYDIFHKAFFLKKEYLDKEHHNYKKQ
ncbi:MAG: DUF3795 domain-containing protein [Promethearchaeota archaeon]